VGKLKSIRVLRAVLVLVALCGAWSVRAQEVPGCGSLHSSYGPFDYRDPGARGEALHLVEIAHFTNDVAELRRGNTSTVIADIDYTLRVFPHHARALASMSQ